MLFAAARRVLRVLRSGVPHPCGATVPDDMQRSALGSIDVNSLLGEEMASGSAHATSKQTPTLAC